MVKYILNRGEIHVTGIINMALFINNKTCAGNHMFGTIFENLIAVIFQKNRISTFFSCDHSKYGISLLPFPPKDLRKNKSCPNSM